MVLHDVRHAKSNLLSKALIMNNTNQKLHMLQTQDDRKIILGGLSLTLVVSASLVALWRGSFVSTLSAETASLAGDVSSFSGPDANNQMVNHVGVILVPGQASSIQAAIDQATDGSVIFVAPGEYRESIRIHGKNISLQATCGAASTRILGNGQGGPIASVENSKFMIDGFCMQDGRGDNGRGMAIVGSNATIVNCTFTNNMGGVSLTNSLAQFDHCAVTLNQSAVQGGGVWAWQSDVRMNDCNIDGNATGTFGGGVYAQGGSIQLLNVSFMNNRVKSGAWGGGLYSDRANVNLNACVMQGNFSQDAGAAMYVLDASAKIRASTFKNNSSIGSATVVGANAQFDIQDSILEADNESIAAAARDETIIEMAGADAMETSAMMMAVK